MGVLESPVMQGASLAPLARLAWADRAAWAAAGAVLALHVLLLWRFAVDWPLHDDFTQIVAIPGYLVQLPGPWEKLELLTALAIEHRATTVRLFGWLGSSLPGGLDFGGLILLGNAMAILAGACVVAWFPPTLRAGAALLAALLLTSVTHYAAQYHATGALQHFGVSLYALGALFALARGHRLVVPGLLALAAVFTSASGLIVFPAAGLLLALQNRRGEAVAWVLVGCAILARYFVGYEGPAGQRGISSFAGEPLELLLFALAALGCIGETFRVSVAIGMLLVATWLVLLGTGTWRRVPPVILAGTLLFALTCAVIAVGRASFGAEGMTLSRYRIYSGLALLLTFAALAWAIDARHLRAVQLAAIAFAAALYALAWNASMPSVVDQSTTQRMLRDHFAAENSGFYAHTYTREFGDFTLRRARELGVYMGALKATAPLRLVGGMPSAGRESGSFRASLYGGERVVSVAGWAPDNRRDVDLWLEGQSRAFRTRLQTVRYPGGSGFGEGTAFHGTVSIADLPRGRYRIGYADERAPGVSWTADSFEVR